MTRKLKQYFPWLFIAIGLVTSVACLVFLSVRDPQRIEILTAAVPFVSATTDSGEALIQVRHGHSVVTAHARRARFSYSGARAYVVQGARLVQDGLEVVDSVGDPKHLFLFDLLLPYQTSNTVPWKVVKAAPKTVNTALGSLGAKLNQLGVAYDMLPDTGWTSVTISSDSLSVAAKAVILRLNTLADTLYLTPHGLRAQYWQRRPQDRGECVSAFFMPTDWFAGWYGALLAIQTNGTIVDIDGSVGPLTTALTQRAVVVGFFDEFVLSGCGPANTNASTDSSWSGSLSRLQRASVLANPASVLNVRLGNDTVALSRDDLLLNFASSDRSGFQPYDDRTVYVTRDSVLLRGVVRDVHVSGQQIAVRRWAALNLGEVLTLLALAIAPLGLGIKMLWEGLLADDSP